MKIWTLKIYNFFCSTWSYWRSLNLCSLESDPFVCPVRKSLLIVRHNKTLHWGELWVKRLKLELNPQLYWHLWFPFFNWNWLKGESHILSRYLIVCGLHNLFCKLKSLWTTINNILMRFSCMNLQQASLLWLKQSAKSFSSWGRNKACCGWRDVRVFRGIQCCINVTWLSLPRN